MVSLSLPHQYPSHRREERLAAQIARSKESRQEGFMRGREEFLASAITSASAGGPSVSHERERSMGIFSRMPPGVS